MVDRNSVAGSLSALKRMTAELKNGNPLAIFPEGTRSTKAPVLAPFKPGAFALAIQMQVPVVPVSFVNNWKRLGTGGFFRGRAGPGISKVIIHPPVVTTGMGKNEIDLLQEKVRQIIGGPLLAK